MRIHEIDERATTTASPETVYALLADGSTWAQWSKIDSFELQREGREGGESIGAIRVFRTGRTTSIEELVELVPGRRLSYILLEGLPLDGYRADVDLTPTADGTEIRWHSTFRPRRRGTGAIYRWALGTFIRRCVRGLASEAATVAAPPPARFIS